MYHIDKVNSIFLRSLCYTFWPRRGHICCPDQEMVCPAFVSVLEFALPSAGDPENAVKTICSEK